MHGKLRPCELLLDKGADVNWNNVRSVFYWFTLAQGRWSVLTLAAENGHADVCALLVKRGANVHWKDEVRLSVHSCSHSYAGWQHSFAHCRR